VGGNQYTNPVTQQTRDDVQRLYDEGCGHNEIARRLKCSPRAISVLAAEMGLSFDRTATEEATRARVADLAEKRSIAAEADKDGGLDTGAPDHLTAAYVPNIRPARAWRHIPTAAYWGQSDFQGIEGILDALDETYSSWMRDVQNGKGRIIVANSLLESTGPGQRGPGCLEHHVLRHPRCHGRTDHEGRHLHVRGECGIRLLRNHDVANDPHGGMSDGRRHPGHRPCRIRDGHSRPGDRCAAVEGNTGSGRQPHAEALGVLSRDLADGHFGTATVHAYAAWQRRCGYKGTAADGIPGAESLTKLGARRGFTVTP
jgi:hypothetical protein